MGEYGLEQILAAWSCTGGWNGQPEVVREALKAELAELREAKAAWNWLAEPGRYATLGIVDKSHEVRWFNGHFWVSAYGSTPFEAIQKAMAEVE